MFIHTLLTIFAKTILEVLTNGHAGLLISKDYPVSFELQVVFDCLSNIGEVWLVSAFKLSHSGSLIQYVGFAQIVRDDAPKWSQRIVRFLGSK